MKTDNSGSRLKVLTLVGARPQFIKASMLSRALYNSGIHEILVHSGQHYDRSISQVFFDELRLPKPTINLEAGSGSHAYQTGNIMTSLESYLHTIKPISCIVVYGDTNTTLAGALVAAKSGIPVVHIEAGLRSRNKLMPEEVNRISTDRLSRLLFCPTKTALDNLDQEGIREGVYLSGDVMLDATIFFRNVARAKETELLGLIPEKDTYFLSTIHRPSNTNNLSRLSDILDAFSELDHPVLMPLHPRTKKSLGKMIVPDNIKIIKPVGYLLMLLLIERSKAVITDSGGLQKEAFWLKRPCITLRRETEWRETLVGGWNRLVDADPKLIKRAVMELPNDNEPQSTFGRPLIGESAASFIASKILEYFRA